LAEKAEFSPEHAQTIDYASHYTDDSTEFGKNGKQKGGAHLDL